MYPERPAVLDSTLRIALNWEVFFFSDAKAMQMFQKQPLLYCGLLTDPVSQERFQPTRRSPRTEYKGREYYFMSKDHRATFRRDPAKHARRTGM